MRLSQSCLQKVMSASKSFLFWFSNEQSNFKNAELVSLCKLFDINMDYYSNRKVFGPFVLMDLPSEDYARKIMSRTVLVYHCIEVWAFGDSMDELHQNFKNNLNVVQPYVNNSFRIRVETYGKKVQLSQKIEFIETFDYLPIEGPVDLNNPQLDLKLFQHYGFDTRKVPKNPIKCFFGRWVAGGQRHLVAKTSLKTRKFIGNTSMDPLLSLIMSNLALIKPNDLVFDPFVGTGSLLVSAAMMGGFVFGSDIDYLMLHARTRPSRAKQIAREDDESLHANFKQYGVEKQYIDILVADAALINSAWRDDFQFDAIITDPPYGIREPSEKIGSLRTYKVKDEHLDCHYPSKIDYSICDLICDLVDSSAKRLTIGGRLVFWIPVSRDSYEEEKLPKHHCFDLVANCEQVLTAYASRRLLVMEKICEPTETSRTILDSSETMYRCKISDPDPTNTRKERKKNAILCYGETTKRGQVRE